MAKKQSPNRAAKTHVDAIHKAVLLLDTNIDSLGDKISDLERAVEDRDVTIRQLKRRLAYSDKKVNKIQKKYDALLIKAKSRPDQDTCQRMVKEGGRACHINDIIRYVEKHPRTSSLAIGLALGLSRQTIERMMNPHMHRFTFSRGAGGVSLYSIVESSKSPTVGR